VIRLLLLVVALAAAWIYALRFRARSRRERIAQVRSAFLIALPTAHKHGPALKAVGLRSGAVRLMVPQAWAEEYPDEDHATFRDPENTERVFRLESSVVAWISGDLGARLEAHVAAEPTTVCELLEGRVLLKCLTVGPERDRHVVLFRWFVAAPLPPARARVAEFILCVPEAVARDPLTRDLVARMELAVRASRLD
jgi:hypothetical protein